MATSSSNRGKYAEGRVRDYLKVLEGRYAAFTFNRISDAHSAGGRGAVAQPGDFQAFFMQDDEVRWNYLIEVKEVDHEYRLPHKNLSIDSFARMRKRQMAGSICAVMIYFKPLKAWRVFPLSTFAERTGGSWDLRDFPVTKLEPMLNDFFQLT